MRGHTNSGSRWRLSDLVWALPRLSHAGNGHAVGVLSVWVGWNHVLEWVWRPRSVRPGGILRYRLAHHWGRGLTLKDGTRVAFGDRVIELHFDNETLYRMAGAPEWNPWEVVERIDADLAALAERVSTGGFEQVRALHGVTLFASPGPRLGFELHRVPHNLAWSLQRFYLISLLPIYHRDGWREFDRMRRHRWPAELWMSVNQLMGRRRVRGVAAAS